MSLVLGQFSNMEGVDLTKIDTKYPILQSGQLLPFEITEVKVDDNKNKDGKLLIIDLKLDAPALDKEGKEVQPGFKNKSRIGLTPSGGRDQNMIVRDICILLDAIYGEAGRKAIDLSTFDFNNIVGSKLTCRTFINPAKDGFDESTGLKFVAKSA